MINIDMWNNAKATEADKITMFFNDVDSMYWGNIYKNNTCIGDYSASSWQDVEKAFNTTFNYDF